MSNHKKSAPSAPLQSSVDPNATDAQPPPVHLLGYLLNRLTARMNQRWLQQLRPHGLTVQRWQVLSVLAAFDGARVGQLAEMCGQEQPVLSRLVDQMQRDELVERRRSESDSRIVQVWLREPGRTLLTQLGPAAEDFIAQLVAPLDHDEQRHIMQLLSKLLDGLEA